MAGIGWGAVATVYVDTSRSDVTANADPQIAVDPNGNAIAVWSVYDWSWNHTSVRANRYVVGTGWAGVTNLSTESVQVADSPKVALDSNGNAIAVWRQNSNNYIGVQANRYTVGTGWGTTEHISAADDTYNWSGYSPQVAFDPNGNAIAVWYDYAKPGIKTNRYVLGTGWGSAQAITDPSISNYIDQGVQLAIDKNGNAIAVWNQEGGWLYANRYVAGTGWGITETIDPGYPDYSEQIAFDQNGNAIAIWGYAACNSSNIQAIPYLVGVGWGSATRCYEATNYVNKSLDLTREPQIVIDQNGNATAVWVRGYGSYGTIYASTSTVTQSWIYSNSIGTRNSIKITDMSGTLSSSGAAITVSAWDVSGTSLSESGSAAALKLYNNGTTTILGASLPARFPTGSPVLYALRADSSKYIITNVKSSSDGTLNVPNGYTSGTTKFVANSVGPRNSIKITDMSGSLSTPGAISIAAWDVNGNSIAESGSATPLTLSNHGTTTIAGNELIARFPTGAPMSYEFTVGSTKYVITNVKSSADGTINMPYAYTSGTTTFVANSIGPRNTIKISDVSGSISSSGAVITITAWDVNGNAITETTTTALKLYSRGTASITGTALAARFTGGTPISYEFTINSSKYIITNVKSSSDSSINIPAVYTSGTTTYASNDISSRSTIKITDASGTLTSAAAITLNAWDVNGNAITESGSAIPLTLVSNGTTTLTGTSLIARFPTGTPVLYEFTIGSTKYLVTNVTSNTAGTLTIPSVYTSGVAGGI